MPGRVHFWWYISVLFCFAATGFNVFFWFNHPDDLQYALQSFICLGATTVILMCKPEV